MHRQTSLVAHPIERGSADAEARLAAAVVRQALTDAQAGDVRARHFATTPHRLAPWAALLHVAPDRLSALAAEAIAARPRRPKTSSSAA